MSEVIKHRKDVSDVVISTRIRFARNMKDYPFPCRLNEEKKRKVASIVKEAALGGHNVGADTGRGSFPC